MKTALGIVPALLLTDVLMVVMQYTAHHTLIGPADIAGVALTTVALVLLSVSWALRALYGRR